MKTAIRLIALDLDGTLLDSQKHLSARNIEALRQCAARGIEIVPTTGRSADGIFLEVRQLPGVHYAITTNGGTVVRLPEEEVLEARRIPWEMALRLMKIIRRYPVMYDPYVNGRGISQKEFLDHMDHYGLSPVVQELIRSTRDVVPDIVEEVTRLKKDVDKLNVYVADQNLLDELADQLHREGELLITSSIGNNLEINAAQAHKGGALTWLAKHLGIDMENVIAFGDGGNDLTMIQQAGIGVAMENGQQEVREAADLIAPSNDADGVAAVLEKLILQAEGE